MDVRTLPSPRRRHAPFVALPALALSVALSLASCGGGDEPATDLTGAAAEGQRLSTDLGCAGCHGDADGGATIGPSWVGSWGSNVELSDGSTVPFDAAYVIASIREPDSQRRTGDWVRMPTYAPDQMTDDEIDHIVAYLEALG